jgi:ATP-dependent helicase/DNAse subunit B
MKTANDKIKLSASKIKTLQTCSYLYYCKYVLKLPDVTNSGASRGLCAHTVLECMVNPRHKKHFYLMEQGVMPPSIERLILKHARALNVADPDNMTMIREMISTAIKNDFYCFGAKELRAEDEFRLESENYIINGFIDKTAIYPDRIEIWDYKTSKAKFSKEEIAANLQVLMYSLAVYKQQKRIPHVKFLFLRFPKSPIQEAKKCTKLELKGFEAYLTEIAKYLANFDETKAKLDYAADDQERMWLCGRNNYEGKLKKDGTVMWGCQFKFAFDYYAIYDKEGKLLYTSKEFVKVKDGQTIKKQKYLGCPRHQKGNYSNTQSGSYDSFDF